MAGALDTTVAGDLTDDSLGMPDTLGAEAEEATGGLAAGLTSGAAFPAGGEGFLMPEAGGCFEAGTEAVAG